jgi:bifunctional enzyme CysN/CysC
VARRLESRLVSDGRHAYLLHSDNLRRGLDADLAELSADENVRRFGEVARLLVDTGQIVLSPVSTVGSAVDAAVETLVHPAPVIRVWIGDGTAEAREADLRLEASTDVDAVATAIIDLLKSRAILAQLMGGQAPRYGSYSI